MMDAKILKENLPVITAFIGAFLAYAFSGRRYKHERFYNDVSESLKDFYSPVFHGLRYIKIELDPKNKENLVEKFVQKYTHKDVQLYKCHSEYLI